MHLTALSALVVISAAAPAGLLGSRGAIQRAHEATQDSRTDSRHEASHIELHESPAIDLYLQARAASAPGKTGPSEALDPVIEAVRALDRALGGSPLAWAPLDGNLPGCQSAADLRTAFARAPKTLELRGGTRVELRKYALAIADALVVAEPELESLWNEHRERIGAARARWEKQVGDQEGKLLAFHLASLGMRDPGLALPVFLVGEAPWPGAVTVRDEEGRGVSFVGVNAAEGSGFFEVILHEVTHSLDLAAGEESAFGELRSRLVKAGLGLRDKRLFDLPHALMFVQSAASIRRVIDPAHRDYGEVEDVYARLGNAAELIRGFWNDHLDGKLTRDEALDEIVVGLELDGR